MRTRSGYQRLPPDYDTSKDDQRDARFDQVTVRVPWGAVSLAVFLTVFGILSFVMAWLHFTQRLLGKEQAEVGFTILAFMTFTPGAYHSWLAYGAWKGWYGYSWDMIPTL